MFLCYVFQFSRILGLSGLGWGIGTALATVIPKYLPHLFDLGTCSLNYLYGGTKSFHPATHGIDSHQQNYDIGLGCFLRLMKSISLYFQYPPRM